MDGAKATIPKGMWCGALIRSISMALEANYPHAQLRTDGENVGLPAGQMGNSEVGHLNIGAGRVVYQDLMKINRAIADGSIAENPEIKSRFRIRPQQRNEDSFHGPRVGRRCAQFVGASL